MALGPQIRYYIGILKNRFSYAPRPTCFIRTQSSSTPPDRTWIDNFKPTDIPPDSFKLSFARSSGPGGQNVNKLNTKVLLRLCLRPPPTWIPSYCIRALTQQQASKINKAHELLVSSERHRTQQQNINDCYMKLYTIIKAAGYIPRQTSAEQHKKVANLIKANQQDRLESKKFAKSKKSDRRVSRDY